MPVWLIALRASITFLTRIPVGGFPYPQKTWEWISIWFPLVGALLGGMQAAVWLTLSDYSEPTRVIVAVIVGVLVTGGFHEDGLSDSIDALGGAYDRNNLLRILKDSRIGAFGALALILAFMLKISLLVDLGHMAPAAFILSQSLSRALPVIQLGIQPYVRREDSKSKSRDVARSGRMQASIAVAWVFIIAGAGFVAGVASVIIIGCIVAMVAVGVSFGFYVQRRAGGLTGDFMGALQQFSDIAILFAMVSA